MFNGGKGFFIEPPILTNIIENSEKNMRSAKFGNNLLNGDKTLFKFVNKMYNEEINTPLIILKKAKEIYNNKFKVKIEMS